MWAPARDFSNQCKHGLFFFWPRHTAFGILLPQPGIEPGPRAVKAPSPNHWSARELIPQRGHLKTVPRWWPPCQPRRPRTGMDCTTGSAGLDKVEAVPLPSQVGVEVSTLSPQLGDAKFLGSSGYLIVALTWKSPHSASHWRSFGLLTYWCLQILSASSSSFLRLASRMRDWLTGTEKKHIFLPLPPPPLFLFFSFLFFSFLGCTSQLAGS